MARPAGAARREFSIICPMELECQSYWRNMTKYIENDGINACKVFILPKCDHKLCLSWLVTSLPVSSAGQLICLLFSGLVCLQPSWPARCLLAALPIRRAALAQPGRATVSHQQRRRPAGTGDLQHLLRQNKGQELLVVACEVHIEYLRGGQSVGMGEQRLLPIEGSSGFCNFYKCYA